MITIDLLMNHLHHIPTLTNLWCEVLGSVWVPSITKKDVRAWMESWYEESTLPVGHIALFNGQPIGVCALQQNDGIRPDLWPWLTDLCVAKAYQKQGVGKLLIEATKNKAFDLGYEKLYLFAFDPQLPKFYEKFGFRVIAHDQHRGLPVTVMACLLEPIKKRPQKALD